MECLYSGETSVMNFDASAVLEELRHVSIGDEALRFRKRVTYRNWSGVAALTRSAMLHEETRITLVISSKTLLQNASVPLLW